MKKGFFLLIVLSLGLSACSVMQQRAPGSGYYQAGTEVSPYQSIEDFYRDRARQKWTQAKEELGITKYTQELSEREAQAVRVRLALQNLENPAFAQLGDNIEREKQIKIQERDRIKAEIVQLRLQKTKVSLKKSYYLL